MLPTILAFDTSAAHCAAIVIRGNTTAAYCVEDMARGQAEALLPLVARVMADACARMVDLDAIAVGIGPGNFTGVRIAVAAARGLALALGRPAIGVTTFEALAHNIPRPVTVTTPAPRGLVHRQSFAADGPNQPETLPGEAPPPDPTSLVTAIGLIATNRLGKPQPRPAPYYLRGPEADARRDPALRLLP